MHVVGFSFQLAQACLIALNWWSIRAGLFRSNIGIASNIGCTCAPGMQTDTCKGLVPTIQQAIINGLGLDSSLGRIFKLLSTSFPITDTKDSTSCEKGYPLELNPSWQVTIAVTYLSSGKWWIRRKFRCH